MTLHSLIRSALVLPLLLAAPAAHAGAWNVPLPGAPADGAPPIVLAQAADPRIAALEEQVRQLNGLVEELNFQILQMQDQLQRIQDDNEFRFQELEQGSGGSPASQREGRVTPEQPASEDFAAVPSLPENPAPVDDGTLAGDSVDVLLGEPPREFGSIVFDAQGNVVGSTMDENATSSAPSGSSIADETTVAALPPAGDAEELYRNSYEFILSGDYGTAETGFRDLISRFPGSEMESDAHFWLGEALLAQQKPREAAEVFLQASRDFPQSRKAPEMLFKLGVSLAALDQREVACATFSEVGNRYPNTSDVLREAIRQEQAQASC